MKRNWLPSVTGNKLRTNLAEITTQKTYRNATKKEEIKFMAKEGKINFTGRKMIRVIYLDKYECRIAVLSSTLLNLRKPQEW